MGAFIAVMAACNIDFNNKVIQLTIQLANKYRTNFYNNITFMGKYIKKICEECLPENAHQIVSGRCYIGITKITLFGLKKIIISNFTSKQDLINAIIASMYIPLWTNNKLLKYRNNLCIDGCLTGYCHKLYNNTITVTFDKSGDIYPLTTYNTSMLYPSSDQDIYKLIELGKKDYINYYKKL